MKSKFLVSIAILTAALCGCGADPAGNATGPQPTPVLSGPARSPSPVPTSVTPKNGDYPGRGVVTKIKLELGSVGLNHEDIKDVMPAMQMEFYVTDKKLLDGLKL